jgi:signal transduction histidine kinase
MALHEARDGSLWIGTRRGGAYRVSSDWSHVDSFGANANDPASLPSTEVWDFEEDSEGHLWIATSDGICRWMAPGVRCYRPPNGDVAANDLTRDADGWLWIARENGVISFNPSTGAFGPGVDLKAQALSVYADRDSGYVWANAGRLFRARVSRGRIVGDIEGVPAAVSPFNPIFAFQRDREGALWLASDSGLQRWDVAGRRFVSVPVPELRGATVFSIAEDGQHRFWLGTGNGLVQYSPATGISRRYRRPDGILSGEFNRHAALQRRNGEMVFGGLRGLTVFRPERVNAHGDAPPVVFTRWRKMTANGIAEAAPDAASALHIGPGDRAVTIEFAALTFRAGPARRYRYRLEGLDPDWIEVADHTVTYASLPPGDYVFRVQSSAGSEGDWHEPGAALPVRVVPSLWRRTWFRSAIALLLVAVVLTAHRVRLRHALATERLRLRISRDLHDEIGAGLSSIALLSDSVGGNGAVAEQDRMQLGRISQSARQMVDDLRDIVWAIDPDADRLEHIVSRMRDVADTLRPGARVTFQVSPQVELSRAVGMAARRDLFLIYKEMLHNVARHARASAVEITLTSRHAELELVISDDGCGFDPGNARAGTGLKSIHERAARLGGTFQLASQTPGGTTARLTLRRT